MSRMLPVRVRPLHLESPESYGRRLALANGLPARVYAIAARQMATAGRAQALKEALELWCEKRGGLPIGHFQHQTWRVSEGLPGRSLCRLCAHGATVGQVDHYEMNCCLRHGLWTGPGISPEDQFLVGAEVLAAERRYRRLLRRKRIHLTLMRAIASILASSSGGDRTCRVFVAESYPAMIALADMLTDREVHRRLFDTYLTFAEAHARLTEHLAQAIPGADDRLAESVWLLLRPTYLWLRLISSTAAVGEEFVPLIGVNPADIPSGDRLVRPLEPFRRFLGLLRQGRSESSDHRLEMYMIAGQGRERDSGLSSIGSLLMCEEGHVVRRKWHKAVAALDEGRSMCPICNGGQPLPGYNTLAETHPRLALEWDARNNGTDASSLVAGSNKKGVWRCHDGHLFTATVANRALNGSGCPVCANVAVITGVNDLATTHPGLAAEWHTELNGELRPEHVIGARNVKVAWLCPNRHVYWKTIGKRKGGQGCPVCSGRRVAAGVNDLATTHPVVAVEWHPRLNGSLSPAEVSAGSEALVYWVCPARHAYEAPVLNRTGPKSAGCPYCTSRKLLTGFNDLATKYPALARDWNPERNGGLSAAEVLPGSKPRWWKCVNGHQQEMMFRNRLRAGGCTDCPGDQRAAASGRRNDAK